jgi:hypothetical protein
MYVVVDAPSHEAMAAIAGTVTGTGALSGYENAAGRVSPTRLRTRLVPARPR